MASIQKRGAAWFAQIRRAGQKSISKSFPTKSLANEWARKVEAEIDAKDYRDPRKLNSITFGDLIVRYRKEMETVRPFGKNKDADGLSMSEPGAMAEQLNAEIRTHTTVSGIDPGHKRLWIGEEAVPYRDLVLAWGAEAIQVPVAGDAHLHRHPPDLAGLHHEHALARLRLLRARRVAGRSREPGQRRAHLLPLGQRAVTRPGCRSVPRCRRGGRCRRC